MIETQNKAAASVKTILKLKPLNSCLYKLLILSVVHVQHLLLVEKYGFCNYNIPFSLFSV